jgi:hypothetical protein
MWCSGAKITDDRVAAFGKADPLHVGVKELFR